MRRNYTLAGLTLAALVVIAIVAAGTISHASTQSANGSAASTGAAGPLPPGHPPIDQGAQTDTEDAQSKPSGDLSATIATLEEKRAQDPGDTKTALALAAAYLSAEQPGKAIDVYNDILDREPSNQTARAQLALALHAAGDDEQAVAILQDLLKSTPDNQTAHYNLAIIYFSQDKADLARREWLRAARIDPSSRIGASAQNFVDLMEGRTTAPTTAP